VVTAVSAGYFAGGLRTAEAQVSYDHQITGAAWERVALAGGLGLVGLVGAIILSGLAGRRIIRRLADLGQAALTLADQQLPDVVARLRRGEEVDEVEAAPPVRPGTDEIGQVGQAFEVARRTAIQAAVDEARLRRGVNEVFRNIARRGQSLLHRQLAMLDAMERRITDPELLDDLFRLDHLTTRMRRHAEGLIILSGAPPGRGWRNPVQLVDVLRAAAAEVEDYARVGVMCASRAALTGAAVADVIHLLAELIENATTLSPPFAPVSVTGSLVAKGFGIEIEDRGLGMSEQRLAELNGRLARPPEFNPSDSEQLGLFVVSQLAKRHGIQVSLLPSPLGGTKAIVLIPASLVVLGEDYEESSAEDCTVTWVSVQATAVSSRSGGLVAGALTQAAPGPPEGPAPVSLAARAVDFARSVPKAEPFDVFAPLSRDNVASSAGPAMISAAWPQPPTAPEPVPRAQATYVALPRRIRQASLAPQLREDYRMSSRSAPPGDCPEHVADSRSPEQIRSTLSAMQRGWEQGRGLWDAGAPSLEGPGEDR
jgi:signal transduction histidine kinase